MLVSVLYEPGLPKNLTKKEIRKTLIMSINSQEMSIWIREAEKRTRGSWMHILEIENFPFLLSKSNKTIE